MVDAPLGPVLLPAVHPRGVGDVVEDEALDGAAEDEAAGVAFGRFGFGGCGGDGGVTG